MKNPNLKIPLILVNPYNLPILAILAYSELNGLYSKYGKCDITDKELAKRFNRSIASIQRAMHELRKRNLIHTKQKPNYKGRLITVDHINMEKYLLVPVQIVRNKDLSLGALLVYGSLYSRYHKQRKINADKRKSDVVTVIFVTNKNLASELGKTSKFIHNKVKELVQKNYIVTNSINGVGIEIAFLPVENSNKHGRPKRKLGTKCVSTYEQNEHPPMNRMSIELGTKRATNKYLINNNKDDNYSSSSSNKDDPQKNCRSSKQFFDIGELLTKPVYYDSIPNENDMPPQMPYIEITKEVAELNTLDHQISIQNTTQHKTSPITGKSGSESGNKYIDRSTKPTRKKYHAYNGFNLDYQVDQLRRMLNSKTNKRYIITSQQIPLIEQRLKDGFTLYDFERAIDYLVQQKQSISVKELVINISNYLNKINSN